MATPKTTDDPDTDTDGETVTLDLGAARKARTYEVPPERREALQRKSPVRVEVHRCNDTLLMHRRDKKRNERDALEEKLDGLGSRAVAWRRLRKELSEVEADLMVLEAEVEAATVTYQLTALSGKKMEALRRKFPATNDQKKDARERAKRDGLPRSVAPEVNYNIDLFGPHLIAHCMGVEPQWVFDNIWGTEDQTLPPDLSDAELDAILAAPEPDYDDPDTPESATWSVPDMMAMFNAGLFVCNSFKPPR